jgi:TPR repeat protein
MADQDNLPIKATTRDVAVSTEQRGSLVARGLVAVQNRKRLTQTKDTAKENEQLTKTAEWMTNAANWLRMAAEGAPPDGLEAELDLRAICKNGESGAIARATAEAWFQRAATVCKNILSSNRSNPSPYYAFFLGGLYEEGLGVKQDDAQAVYWYGKAGEQGHTLAQWLLAGMFEYGRGVIPNIEQAIHWYRKAAENGDERAQRDLEGIYDIGRGGTLDEEQAVHWNRKSAEEGHSWAMFNLGVMYQEGRRVEKDEEQAVTWFRSAADQGHVDAPLRLEKLSINWKV